VSTGTFELPPAPRRRWPWIVVVLAVVAGLVFGGISVYRHVFVSCGSGLKKTGSHDECIGVSGSKAFDSSLKTVMRQISDENKAVAKSGKKSVTVAYVEPITDDPTEVAFKYDIREELEGAYLAQRQLNDAALGGHGDNPQIRLVVANVGLKSQQWKPVADKLIAMTKDGSHLVAVAGFGQSREGTLSLVDALRDAKVPVPMMGATVTADELASKDKVGFFRSAVPNSDQVGAMVKYLKGKQKSEPGYRVMVIRDRSNGDIYNTSLYQDFLSSARTQGLSVLSSEAQYLSGSDGVSNAFSSVADQVCGKKPDAVFFAGRGESLRGFITAMSAPDRRCPVTVLTGDDAVGVYYDQSTSQTVRTRFTSDWKVSGVKVLYSALAHPALPAKLPPPGDRFYQDLLEQYHSRFGGTGGAEFQDGQAILGHDAVWTLGLAIRNAAGPDGAPVTAGSTMNALVSLSSVEGAGGPIQFGPNGDPQNKPMSLVELTPDEKYTFQQVLRP
jgi:ABC-type branched-subunit amino acid transport system substrate-binding protein